MDMKRLKEDFDRDYTANQTTRESAADDLVFYWITQWDDELLANSPLQYRGQFDILRKAGRQILSDLRANPVQPDFKPKDESRLDDAEALDGLYRACDRKLTSQEAYNMAVQDSVVCGYGAWELYTEYATNQVGDRNQVIKREFIPEANNTVFWDASAKAMDKSDAKRCTILKAYTHEGYKDLVEELTGERPESVAGSFSSPEDSYTFKWFDGKDTVHVATIYRRQLVKDKVLTLSDPFGEEIILRESQLEDVMDELLSTGHEIIAEKKIERWEVRKYIVDGEEILNGEEGEVIAGEHIPVVPVYGERAIIEGQEHWEGIVRLAKDPQRLRNFQMSYLADIVSRSPRRKPIFHPEQINGFEFMYEENGPDNNYPYLLQNRFDASGQPLPIGPVGEMPEQPMPQALAASIELTRQAVEDVANPGLPQDIADPDLSGKAVLALQNRIDQQAYVYQDNLKFAKRRDAEIFASMAGEVYDAPRQVMLETPDGTSKPAQLMRVVIDNETGEPVVLNDLTNLEVEVYAEIGPSYASQKEQTRDRLQGMMEALPDGDPAKNVMMLTLLEITEGVNLEHVRDYARRQLILGGFKEPETEEEAAMLQNAQQQQQPDANMLLAQGEMMKGQAALIREQREAQKDAVDAQNENAKTQIDAFEAETGRMTAQINAQKAQADIERSRIDGFAKQIEAGLKVQNSQIDRLRATVNQPAP